MTLKLKSFLIKIFSFIYLFFSINSAALKCQNLSNQINQISQQYDMMGGSIVIFCENEIIDEIYWGEADFQRNINTTAFTKYRIASISKTITALATMKLVEQNLINLDEDIDEILGYNIQNPYYPNIAITTRMLLSHTSGIVDGTSYSTFLTATTSNTIIPNLSELLISGGTYYSNSLFNNIQPGTYFNYANINYVILGTIIEKISNQRFDQFCSQNIFQPLGIDASFNPADLSNIDDVAVLYRKIGGVWTPQSDNFQGIPPSYPNTINYLPGTNGARFGPQGGLRCSARDLSKIFTCLLNMNYCNSALLQPSSVHQMLEDNWTYNGSNGNNYYGLFRSWGLGIHRITSTLNNDVVLPGSDLMFGHTGEAYGLVSDAYIDTSRKIGFVFITNGVGTGYSTSNSSAFYTIEQDIFEAIESESLWNTCDVITSSTPLDRNDWYCHFDHASQTLYIDLKQADLDSDCIVFSSNGQLISQLKSRSGIMQLDLSNIPSGVYGVRKGGFTKKFVKL
jgi:CubicO group peptidase (beta-lactamase class C family)